MIRNDDASRVELGQSEERDANFQYSAQARVLGVKLRWRVRLRACCMMRIKQPSW